MSIKKSAHEVINRMGYHMRSLDDLTRLMNQAGSDKGFGLWGRHYYTRVYHRLLNPLRDSPITFVEIGLLRPERDHRRVTGAAEGASEAKAFRAPSLQAWREYLRRATLVGFDIDDFSGVRLPDTKIIQGDMSNADDLRRLLDACPGGMIDVLIDDGSHASHHQQIAFSMLFPHVRPGGMYFIEDCHWQDPAFEANGAVKTRDVFHEFRRSGTLSSPHIAADKTQELGRGIESVMFFDSIEPCMEDTEDALCLIRKKA